MVVRSLLLLPLLLPFPLPLPLPLPLLLLLLHFKIWTGNNLLPYGPGVERMVRSACNAEHDRAVLQPSFSIVLCAARSAVAKLVYINQSSC